MNQKEFRPALIEYIRAQARPVDKFSHQPRLYELTRQVGAGESYDDDVVFAAVWLHDLGVFVGHRPEELESLAAWDCVAYAMKQAPVVLKQLWFPGEKIPAVVEVIRTHQPAFSPTTIEGIIVRDADILEQLGAVSVLRTVCKIGRDSRFDTFPDALRLLRKNADTLPAQLRLETSRELAEPKLQALRAFIAAAAEEGCGALDGFEAQPWRKDWEALVKIATDEMESTLGSLPAELRERAVKLPITFEPRPSAEFQEDGIDADILGLFLGTEFADEGAVPMPSQIILFLENLWEMAGGDEAIFREEVRRTLLHELGHYLGLDEDDLVDRGLE